VGKWVVSNPPPDELQPVLGRGTDDMPVGTMMMIMTRIACSSSANPFKGGWQNAAYNML
jgi:hypothetical protein